MGLKLVGEVGWVGNAKCVWGGFGDANIWCGFGDAKKVVRVWRYTWELSG